MPVTTLDLKTAVVVVDLQKGIIGLPTIHPVSAIIQQTQVLLTAFRAKGLPVVLVNVAGAAPGRTERPRIGALPEGFADLIPELGQQPADILVTKRSWGAFANTDLGQHLKVLGVTQVVITGIATGTGVEATARQAYELGFNVTIASDAISDFRKEAHDYSLTEVFPRLGEIGLSQEIVNLLPTP
jgi:nicotinamidase-related amidase